MVYYNYIATGVYESGKVCSCDRSLVLLSLNSKPCVHTAVELAVSTFFVVLCTIHIQKYILSKHYMCLCIHCLSPFIDIS